MTVFANVRPSTSAVRPSWTSAVDTALKAKWQAYIMWRIERAALAQLSALSDRDLKDIGLSRAGLRGAVRESMTLEKPISRYY